MAPEVRRLMWLVAEERDPKAIAEFESRFPEQRAELAKTLAMVEGLKSAKKSVAPPYIPRFTPRRHSAPRTFGRQLLIAAAAVLGAVAFGSYAVTSYMSRPAGPAPRHVGTTQPGASGISGGPLDSPGLAQASPGAKGSEVPAAAPPVREPQVPAAEDPLDRLVTLKVESAPIEAAILMVCKQANLRYELAPGLLREDVQLDYQGVPARHILDELGARYGFTALPQESGKVLIIPAREAGEPASGAGTDTRQKNIPGDAAAGVSATSGR